MDRRIIWAVAYREETGMAGPNIPTIGYPASASDLYRVVGIAQTGHEGWNSCYTDIETCAALARVVEGPVSGWADIEAAETALQAFLWHDRIDVLAPGFKMQHDKFVGYQRCDEIRSDLAFQLFKCCNPYDSILAIERVDTKEGRIISSNYSGSNIVGMSLEEAKMNYMKGTALQAAAISSLPFNMGIPAYFSDPSIEAFHGKRGFFGMFYSIMEKDWKDAKITIPDVDYSVRLPPLISILLDRVNSRDQIPDTLSELRQELEPIRTEMLTFSENMRRSVGENQIEEACKHIRSSFEATFSASRQRKYGAMILRLLQTYKALRSPFDLVIKTLNSEYKPEDPRIVANRTTTGKMFSELLRTNSMYSLLSNLFTKSEIKAMEGTAPR